MIFRRWHKRVFSATLISLLAAGVLLLGGASADPGHPYLALGDSVSFGYITQAGFEYGTPDNFVGFPSYVGLALGKTPTNASCPGETTSRLHLRDRRRQRLPPVQGQLPAAHLLQRDAARVRDAFLNSHRNTKLVTLQLGANDAFLLQRCTPQPGGSHRGYAGGCSRRSRPTSDTILEAIDATNFHGKVDRRQLLLARLQRCGRDGADRVAEPERSRPQPTRTVRSSPTRSPPSSMRPRPPPETRVRRVCSTRRPATRRRATSTRPSPAPSCSRSP